MVSEETKPKKQRNEECIINCLPGDLIERIFLMLQVSTLLRCIDVCKQWHKIIRDPQFVSSHLQHAPQCALLFFPQESVSREPYPADVIVIDEAWSESKFAVPVIGPDDFLCGSCNGLICLYTKTSTLKIANLATGEHLHLEKPVKNSRGDHFLFYSFGCHPSTKEYKIIHFLGDCVEGRSRPQNTNKFSVIQVYTLGDEKWRNIKTPESLSLNCVKNSGAVNVDGIMYWLTEDTVPNWQHALMTFDLSEESFARIELPAAIPEDCAGGGPRRYWLREIDGKVSIATAQVYPSQPRRLVGKLQIWTLDNKGEQRWSQKYNIQCPPDYIPSPNLAHGDKIILPSFGSSLYSYEFLGENFNTKLDKMAKLFDFSPRKPGNMQSYIFVKSLVRLDVYKNAGIVRRPKQREGWELKKWETWEQELSNTEKSWSVVHQHEHDITASGQRNGIAINALLPRILDDEIRREIGMKINQIFPNYPDQHPRPLGRLNCVAQERDKENLLVRMKNWTSITKATRQAMDSIISMMWSALEDQPDFEAAYASAHTEFKAAYHEWVLRSEAYTSYQELFDASMMTFLSTGARGDPIGEQPPSPGPLPLFPSKDEFALTYYSSTPATRQAMDSIISMMRSALEDQPDFEAAYASAHTKYTATYHEWVPRSDAYTSYQKLFNALMMTFLSTGARGDPIGERPPRPGPPPLFPSKDKFALTYYSSTLGTRCLGNTHFGRASPSASLGAREITPVHPDGPSPGRSPGASGGSTAASRRRLPVLTVGDLRLTPSR